MRNKTCLLYGYFGCGNLGDDLLLTACIHGIRKYEPECRFVVRDHGMAATTYEADDSIVYAPVEKILADQTRSRPARLADYLAAYWSLLGRVDWLVFSGGTLFHSRGSMVSLLLQLAICFMARLRGVKIAALAVGVATLPSMRARYVLRLIIAMTKLFTVRDLAALHECDSAKVELTADMVFSLKTQFRPVVASKKTVGISIYPPCFSGENGRYLMGETVAAIRQWQRNGVQVVFLVFQETGVTAGDAAVLRIMETKVRQDCEVAPEWRYLQPSMSSLQNQFADLSVICGMRYHGLVLAAMFGIPFVALAHDNKLSSIAEAYEMPFLPVERTTCDELLQAVAVAKSLVPSHQRLVADVEAASLSFKKLAPMMWST